MALSPKQGLTEYALVVALLALAALGAVAYFRDPIRRFFGAPAPHAAAEARPAPAPPLPR